MFSTPREMSRTGRAGVDFTPSTPARFRIHCQYLFNRFGMGGGSFIQNARNYAGNVTETDFSVQKRLDGDLVGRIEGDCAGPTRLGGLVGEPQAGELLHIRR